MSDRIVVMRAGAIEQSGTPGDIYNYPRTAFVADFVGSANLVTGRLVPALTDAARVAIAVEGDNILQGVAHGRTPGPEPTLSLRTVHLRLAADKPSLPGNAWPVTVERAVFLGDMTQVHVRWAGRELVVRQTEAASFAPGQPAWLSIAPEHCVLLEGD